MILWEKLDLSFFGHVGSLVPFSDCHLVPWESPKTSSLSTRRVTVKLKKWALHNEGGVDASERAGSQFSLGLWFDKLYETRHGHMHACIHVIAQG